MEIWKERNEYAATTSVSDLSSAGFGHMAGSIMTVVADATKMDSDNYPETMRKALVVNTPSFFASIWSLISYLWDEEQRNKMVFLGSDFHAEIAKLIDPIYLPKEFGGTTEWSMPKGGSIAKLNMKFPEDKRPWAKVTVGRSDKHKIVIHIPKVSEQQIIKWEFRTKDYDIAFGLLHSDSKDAPTSEIIKIEKVSSNTTTISGAHRVEKPGLYHLVWDNSSSWTRSKEMELILSVEGDHSIL